jgi:hypothetical protein
VVFTGDAAAATATACSAEEKRRGRDGEAACSAEERRRERGGVAACGAEERGRGRGGVAACDAVGRGVWQSGGGRVEMGRDREKNGRREGRTALERADVRGGGCRRTTNNASSFCLTSILFRSRDKQPGADPA